MVSTPVFLRNLFLFCCFDMIVCCMIVFMNALCVLVLVVSVSFGYLAGVISCHQLTLCAIERSVENVQDCHVLVIIQISHHLLAHHEHLRVIVLTSTIRDNFENSSFVAFVNTLPSHPSERRNDGRTQLHLVDLIYNSKWTLCLLLESSQIDDRCHCLLTS